MSEYGCPACGRKPKRIPYGAKRTKFWCSSCDRGHAKSVSKKTERQKVKRETKDKKENDQPKQSNEEKGIYEKGVREWK